MRIWRFTDGKPGHEKQTAGLLQGLATLGESTVATVDCRSFRAVRKSLREASAQTPELLIGAGRRTHLPMIVSRVAFGGKSVVLMRPGLPPSWFDLVVAPIHDAVGSAAHVYSTPITLAPFKTADKIPDRGVVLVGGDSRHYEFDAAKVAAAIVAIAEQQTSVLWEVCDSRRTPTNLLNSLPLTENLRVFSHTDVDVEFLIERLAKSQFAWVTCDSVSMVHEAILNGATVGVIALPRKKAGKSDKLGSGLQALHSKGWIQAIETRPCVLSVDGNQPNIDPNRQCAEYIRDHLLASVL